LQHDGKSAAVWLLDTASMTVKLQAIQIATADGNEVVVAGGLQPGMVVVAAGVHVLQPGQKVTIYKDKVPVAPVDTAQAAMKIIANSTPAVPAQASASAAK
jgi:hypothetical protein